MLVYSKNVFQLQYEFARLNFMYSKRKRLDCLKSNVSVKRNSYFTLRNIVRW